MSISITQLKADLSADLHGTTVNQLSNFYGLLFRSAAEVLSDYDPEETRRTVAITSVVHGSAFDYASPSDLKNNAIIDIRPYAGRQSSDPIVQKFSADFDRTKGLNATGVVFEVRHDSAVKTIRMSVPSVQALLIDGCDTASDWTAGGLASNLTDDLFNKVQGASAIKYDLTGNGYLERDDLTFDLSAFSETMIFVWVWLTSSAPTGHTLFIGSDSSNYKSVSVSAQFDGTDYREGWNLLGFDLTGATDVGTPDMENGTYVRFATSRTGAVTGVRLDSVLASQGKLLEAEYYSRFLFRDSTGTFKERPTADSDLINLDTDSYSVFYAKVMELALKQSDGDMEEIDRWTVSYEKRLAKRRMLNPSQVRRTQANYYGVRRRNR